MKNGDVLNKSQQDELLRIARESVEAYVREGKVLDFEVEDNRLKEKQGAFVTLHKDGDLRGCIGQIEPNEKPLWEVVRDIGISAATKDIRFEPVDSKELGELEYEVSVLSVPEKINSWRDIELGRHGVIIKKKNRSGVFLPQVAMDTGWNIDEFLGELCSQKAGLKRDCYKDGDVELYTFTAQVFK